MNNNDEFEKLKSDIEDLKKALEEQEAEKSFFNSQILNNVQNILYRDKDFKRLKELSEKEKDDQEQTEYKELFEKFRNQVTNGMKEFKDNPRKEKISNILKKKPSERTEEENEYLMRNVDTDNEKIAKMNEKLVAKMDKEFEVIDDEYDTEMSELEKAKNATEEKIENTKNDRIKDINEKFSSASEVTINDFYDTVAENINEVDEVIQEGKVDQIFKAYMVAKRKNQTTGKEKKRIKKHKISEKDKDAIKNELGNEFKKIKESYDMEREVEKLKLDIDPDNPDKNAQKIAEIEDKIKENRATNINSDDDKVREFYRTKLSDEKTDKKINFDEVDKKKGEMDDKVKEFATEKREETEKAKNAAEGKKDILGKAYEKKANEIADEKETKKHGVREKTSQKMGISPKRKDPDLRKKILAGIGGFAVGATIGIAMAPTGALAISIGRLVYAGAKARLKSKGKKGRVDNVISNIKEKCPRIGNNLERINNFLKKPTVQWFINGMALGYTAGHVVNSFGITDGIVDKFSPSGSNIVVDNVDKVHPNIMTDVPDTSSMTDVAGSNVPDAGAMTDVVNTDMFSSDQLVSGQTFDLSGIDSGYVASGADSSVNLITDAGSNAVVDRVVDVDGEKWVHFLQGDGKGYAWFKVDDIVDYMNNANDIGGRSL